MKPEAMRLVLAEYGGYKYICGEHGTKDRTTESLPDYPNDIVAMIRVAEKMAKERGCSFSALLQKEGWLCCFSGLPLSATSFKPNLSLAMCEAAVRALGKWEE